jgi:hypothetical protein
MSKSGWLRLPEERSPILRNAAQVLTPPQRLATIYGMLKLLPFWDPLRGDPRFEQIVASFAPKEALPNRQLDLEEVAKSNTKRSDRSAKSPRGFSVKMRSR